MPSGRFINLRAKAFNESDLIIDGLSREGERFTFTAKNALKSKKRFAGGVLEPLNFVEFFFTQSKAGYYYIQEAKLVYGFTGLRDDYRKLEVGFHFLKLISKATQEGLADNRRLFDLLGNALKSLETAEDPYLLKLQFELKYLFYLGFLAPDGETGEFVALPISESEKIQLTDDEYNYMNQLVKRQLKQVELLNHDQ